MLTQDNFLVMKAAEKFPNFFKSHEIGFHSFIMDRISGVSDDHNISLLWMQNKVHSMQTGPGPVFRYEGYETASGER